MRTSDGMGPEAAVLSARLAELRAYAIDREAELPYDMPMWVEAAVRAGGPAVEADPVERGGRWARLRRALPHWTDLRRDEPRPKSGVASLVLVAHDRR
jgi:hypothetical protein